MQESSCSGSNAAAGWENPHGYFPVYNPHRTGDGTSVYNWPRSGNQSRLSFWFRFTLLGRVGFVLLFPHGPFPLFRKSNATNHKDKNVRQRNAN